MSKLEGTLNRFLVKNPPKTPGQVAYAEYIGARRLPSGIWVLVDPSRTPPLSVIQQYGPGHTCKACRDVFRSKKPRDRYCRSCRAIIDNTTAELIDALKSVLSLSPEAQRKALQVVEERLTCTYPVTPTAHCGWYANTGRHAPYHDARRILERLPAWVARAHCHFMRHVFWNRFSYSPRFFPHVLSDGSKMEQRRFHYDPKWRRKFDSSVGDLEIELDYPEEGSDLPVEEVVRKRYLAFLTCVDLDSENHRVP